MTKNILDKVKMAKSAAMTLASLDGMRKDMALEAMTVALDTNREKIISANKQDIALAEGLVNIGKLSKALINRLKVDDIKIDEMIAGIRDVMRLEDPIKTLSAIELDQGLDLYQVSCPIGLIGVIFESRPDVIPQIMALCLKSGNATIFKGGSEAANSNRTIFDVLVSVIESIEGMPNGAFVLLESREEVKEMLKLDNYIDLIIPRGSNDFVKYIQDNTSIPVLGHSAGICHIYIDSDVDMKKAIDVSYDSKVQYAMACNAMETLLVHKDIADEFLPKIGIKYNDVGVELRCDDRSFEILKDLGFLKAIKYANDEDWSTEYNDLILSIKVVDSLDDAISHINRFGSHHTDAIVTEDHENAAKFLTLVDSSSVMLNVSTRFADGFRYGKGAEVGISTNKIHARGPVGLEGLLIYKYLILGKGHKVADYVGKNAKKFTHKKFNPDDRMKNNTSRKELFENIERIVLKIGTSSLTNDDGIFNRELTEHIARQVAYLMRLGKTIIIVSSGAIGIGCDELKIPRPDEIPLRQAAAAIGQNILMNEWMSAFSKYDLKVAQIMLTYDAFSNKMTYDNLHNSISELLKFGVVPIINENDPICVHEIEATFGDNDKLSALMATNVGADILIILSDIDGLYDKNPKKDIDAHIINIIEKITPEIESYGGNPTTMKGIGGMKTKIDAAKITSKSGCHMVIANSASEDVIIRILDGEDIGTLFLAK